MLVQRRLRGDSRGGGDGFGGVVASCRGEVKEWNGASGISDRVVGLISCERFIRFVLTGFNTRLRAVLVDELTSTEYEVGTTRLSR